MQNCISPPFFGTKTTGDDHGLFNFLIIPFLSISSICSFSISFSFADNLLAFCLIGFSFPVSIICCTTFVLPTSYFPLINISSLFCIIFFTFFRCLSVNFQSYILLLFLPLLHIFFWFYRILVINI